MKDTDTELKIGLIGAGGMAHYHAMCFGAMDGVRIVGVHDIDPQRAQAFADRHNTPIYPDTATLIREAQPDILDICTPPFAHKAPTLQAAAAGLHVICEKPIARTLADAQEMVTACRRAGVHLCIGHVVRFFPEYARARQAILEGQIGRPALVDLSRQAAPARGTWFWDFERSGGVVVDMMIHDLDWVRWVFGPVQRIYAQGSVFWGEEIPQWVLATLRLTNGVIAHVHAGWNLTGPFRTAAQIVGDAGLLTFDNATPPLTVAYAQPPAERPPMPATAICRLPHCMELAHFLDVIRGQAEPLVPPEDAITALELSLAVLESIQTGQPVILE